MRITTRAWAAGCAGAVAVVLAGGWFVGVQPQLARAADADTSATSATQQAASTQIRVAQLAKVAANQDRLESQAAVLDKAVPSAMQANTFYRRVSEVAALDGVTVQSASLGAVTAYKSPVTAVPAAVGATPAPSASAPASTPTVETPSTPLLAATDPLITSADFSVIAVNVVVTGTTTAGLQFIKDIQGDERLFLVSGVQTTTEADTGITTFTLTGSVYALQH